MKFRILLSFVAVPLLAGCSVSPPLFAARPADPDARVPRIAYQSVSGEVMSFRPATPKGWEDLNRRVTPAQ